MTETRAIPVRVGPYLIERRLGAGGMGVVYLATSPTGRAVALKVVRPQYTEDADFRERFAREVTAARAVSGAFTASVVDVDPDGDPPWLATQFIDAPTLAQLVAERGPLPLDQVRTLAYGLAEALRDIHRAGVVHRDLKPANVMMAEDGPRVIDFGISRPQDGGGGSGQALTTTGKLLGTPPFMSPEQLVRPAEVDRSSDVFALGAVLAFAATGHGPFDADTPYAVAYKVVNGEPDLAGLPEELVGLVSLCLTKEPSERPTPERLMELLAADPSVLAGLRPPTAPAPHRRRRALWAAAAAFAILATGATVVALRPATPSSPHAKPPAAARTGPFVEPTAAARPAGWQSWSMALPHSAQLGAFDRQLSGCVGVGGGIDCPDDAIGTLIRLDRATGRTLWSRREEGTLERQQGSGLLFFNGAPSGADNPRVALSAVDGLTGDVRWRYPYSLTDFDSLKFVGPGSPSLIVLASGEQGWVAVDPRNGKVLHVVHPGLVGHVPSPDPGSPLAAGARLLLEHFMRADGGMELRAVGIMDQRVVWRFPVGTGEAVVPASAGLGDGTVDVLVGPGSSLDGSRGYMDARALVNIDLTTGRARVTTFARTLSGKAVVAGGLIVAQGADGTVVAADARSGQVVWRRHYPGAIGRGPAYADGRVYLPVSGDRIVCLDARTGTEEWMSAQRTDPTVRPWAASLDLLPAADNVVAVTQDMSLFGLVPPH